ncbi:hypothetical protein CVIRNUC_009174 [Coccomyxa viridis]|uniref:RecA family profile 1 domain-containing protein n=1 Tax=Coccomyxa viridis TaxID=1274662 RepID=A0AAV1IH01_9CHLO|nr:hypothetical protein CVIRNUC_009174 [Coccomyxa viridis]
MLTGKLCRGPVARVLLSRLSFLGTPVHALKASPLQQASAQKWRRHIDTRTYSATATAKKSIVFKCRECGEAFPQWKGRCGDCGSWNSLEKTEAYKEPSPGARKGGGGGASAAAAASGAAPLPAVVRGSAGRPRSGWVSSVSQRPQHISEVGRLGYGNHWRLPLQGESGAELARVLGGGVVPGSLTLVGGDPGVGKSTLLLQVAAMLGSDTSAGPVSLPVAEHSASAEENGVEEEEGDFLEDEEGLAIDDVDDVEPLAAAGEAVLYVSAEESVEQVGSRAERMGLQGSKHLYLYSATRLVDVLQEVVAMQPRAVVIDSIQTVYLDDVSGSAGSVSQVRECATALLHVAKRQGVPIFLVGHVTKTGDIAGPRVLEHIVDTVMYMEGERHQAFRLVRGIKNRYGPTDEVGVFEMKEEGLVAVPNPSASFLGDRTLSANASSAVTVMIEGTRPLLLEVQALCSPVHQGQGPPLRIPNGINRNRMNLIMAVLTKHARLRLHTVDCHTNVVGGLLLTEPATDLAVALAIASSYFDRPISPDLAAIGEIGLGGELRPANHIERRIMEAAKLGFSHVIVPAIHAPAASGRLANIDIIKCRTIEDALTAALGNVPIADSPPHQQAEGELIA